MSKQRGIFTGACLILFIILTYFVSTGEVLRFDTVIREWFYSIRTDQLTEVVKAITFMGNTKTVVTICVLLLVVPLGIGAVQMFASKKHGEPARSGNNVGLKITKNIGVPVAVVAIVGSAINKIIKHVMLRPRPDVSLHLIEQGGWSFPSGHSISGLLLYGFLAWLILHYVKQGAGVDSAGTDPCGSAVTAASENDMACHKMLARVAAVILTLLWIGVGLSRIYLGVHYPTDVLGGWTLGMVIMMVTVTVIEAIESNSAKRLRKR